MKPSRNLSILALAVALSGAAFAGGIGNTYNQPQGGAGGNAAAGASAVSGAKADALSLSSALSSANQTLVLGATTAQMQVTESERPVASAIATGLVASNGTCMGSTSAGAQGVTIGLSLGTTWTDEACDARFDAQALTALGLPSAALARLCQKAEIAAAVVATGQRCPAVAKTSEAAPAPVAGYSGNDPIVLRRLASK